MGCNSSKTSVAPLLADGVSPTVTPDGMKRSSANNKPGGRPFPKRPMFCRLSKKAWGKLEELFTKMDPDHSNAVSREEAREFFKGTFGKMSADAMFNEVDTDGSGAITAEEFVKFWCSVRGSGYKEQDVLDEVDQLLEGGAWVDWKDGKDTGDDKKHIFPTRPFYCRLSKELWGKCEELFKKIDHDGSLVLNRDKAAKHFTGNFTKMSVDAMFNEIDEQQHGQITAKMWMRFWIGVKAAGYKEVDMTEEIDGIMEGGAWVDWKDGRNT